MRYKKWLRSGTVLAWSTMAILLAALAGCTPEQKTEARRTGSQAQQQAETALKRAGKELSDGSITLKVKTALLASDQLNASDINVDTRQKVVYLKGAVASSRQKALARRIAEDTVGPGVKVVDQLKVSPPASE